MNESDPVLDQVSADKKPEKSNTLVTAAVVAGAALMSAQILVEQYTGVSIAEKVGRFAIGVLNIITLH